MFACVPHSISRRAALAVAAALLLTLAAAAPAAHKPTAEPLWKAYPLETDPPPSAFADAGAGARGGGASTAAAVPAALERPERSGPSPAITVLFFGSLAAVLLVGATAIVRRARRRSRVEPATCEISWSPGARGGAFRATTWRPGDEPRVVAASRRFARERPGPPDQDWDSREAYAELVRQLVAEGWEPYGRGPAWWEMRLRRSERERPPAEATPPSL